MDIEKLIIILASLTTVSSATVGTIMALQKSLKNSINKTIKEREEKIIEQQKQLFLDYYYPLDSRIKNINLRVKKLEEK